jgi:hypothetical protein
MGHRSLTYLETLKIYMHPRVNRLNVEIPLTQRNTTIKRNLYFLLSNGGGLTRRRLCITLPPGHREGQGYDGVRKGHRSPQQSLPEQRRRLKWPVLLDRIAD